MMQSWNFVLKVNIENGYQKSKKDWFLLLIGNFDKMIIYLTDNSVVSHYEMVTFEVVEDIPCFENLLSLYFIQLMLLEQ